MVQKKTYILFPNFDYPPNGPVALGSIIVDPSDPGRSLNRSAVVPRPPDCPVDTSTKKDWKGTKSRQVEGRVGIWAKFVDVVAGTNLGVQGEKGGDDIYEFNEMETQFFEPTAEYVAQSMALAAVTQYIRKTGFKKNTYMITGLKIVRGAKVASERRRRLGGDVQVGIGGASSGLPVQVGPDLSGKRSKVDKESFGESSDFVFAMRLREIYYQKGRPGALGDREYNKGALYDLKMDLDGNIIEPPGQSEDQQEPTMEILGSAPGDSEADGLGLQNIEAIDDDTGEECECAFS
ncbi:MAG: hypothetical protein Q9220_002894 [cf. Caloplaca sp. 1 TL-2023]